MTGTPIVDVTILSETAVLLNSGMRLTNVHRSDKCADEICVLHNPTEHELRGQPLFYNGKHMIRVVDEETFIDPDDYFYRRYGAAILRNSAKCALCEDVISSSHVHDYRSCSCGEISVDGGFEYLRRSAKDFENFIDLSIVVTKEPVAE